MTTRKTITSELAALTNKFIAQGEKADMKDLCGCFAVVLGIDYTKPTDEEAARIAKYLNRNGWRTSDRGRKTHWTRYSVLETMRPAASKAA